MTKTTTQSLDSLIRSLKFNWVNSDLTEERFPLTPVRSSEYKLYHFDRHISSEDAISEMEKDGYIPASIHELLLWKDWNDKDFVVALGSVGEVHGYRSVPYLDGDGSERGLSLCWWGYGWDSRYRFLAVVRNSPSDTLTSTPALGNSETLTLEAAIEIVKKAGYQIAKIL